MNRSPSDRSAPNDPQTRRMLEGALQRTDLGESLMLDARAGVVVRPARAVKSLVEGEDIAGFATKVAPLADPTTATLVQTATKVNELVAAFNALVVKVNDFVAHSNKNRKAAEKASFVLVDSLKSAKLMEK